MVQIRMTRTNGGISFHLMTETRLDMVDLSARPQGWIEQYAERLSLDLPIDDEAKDESWYCLDRVRVPYEQRDKGFGSRLMEAALSWADANAVNVLAELTPYPVEDIEALKNPARALARLRGFFEKSGFVAVDEQIVIRLHAKS